MTNYKKTFLAIIIIAGIRLIGNAQMIEEINEVDLFFKDWTLSNQGYAYKYFTYTKVVSAIQETELNDRQKALKIKEIRKEMYNNDKAWLSKQTDYVHSSTYTPDARINHIVGTYKNGKQRSFSFEYNSAALPTHYIETKNNQIKTEEWLRYDQNMLLTNYRINKRNHYKLNVNAAYNDSLIVMQKMHKRDSINEKTRWEYDYNEKGQKDEVRYFKKNKLNKRYSYECNPDGELQKEKTNANVCKVLEYQADSSYTESTRYTDHKGKETLNIRHFDSKKRLTKSVYYNAKGAVTWKDSVCYNNGGEITAHYYFTRGKKSNIISSGHTDKYNEKGLRIETRYLKKGGKTRLSYIYTYNAQDLLSEYKKLKADGRVKLTTQITYNTKGLEETYTSTNAKNKLIKKIVMSYEYWD